jgi:hypothetical protein
MENNSLRGLNSRIYDPPTSMPISPTYVDSPMHSPTFSFEPTRTPSHISSPPHMLRSRTAYTTTPNNMNAIPDSQYSTGKRKTSESYVPPHKTPKLSHTRLPATISGLETTLQEMTNTERALRAKLSSVEIASAKDRTILANTTKLLVDSKTEMEDLENELRLVKQTMHAQKIYVENHQGHHDRSLKVIQAALNKLRWVQEFNQSPTRGAPMCPISQEMLRSNEIVVMMKAECDCNCMVKHYHAAEPINRHKHRQLVKCYNCSRAQVTAMRIGTVAQAEQSFAWRSLERQTGCDTIADLYEKHLADTDTQRASQIAQDTAPFRRTIEELKNTIQRTANASDLRTANASDLRTANASDLRTANASDLRTVDPGSNTLSTDGALGANNDIPSNPPIPVDESVLLSG